MLPKRPWQHLPGRSEGVEGGAQQPTQLTFGGVGRGGVEVEVEMKANYNITVTGFGRGAFV